MTTVRLHTDQQYLESLIRGEPDALRSLYQQFYPQTEAFVRRQGGSRDDARDIFQEAILVIFHKGRAGKLELTGPFGAYLFSVSRFLWINQQRKKSGNEVTFGEMPTYKEEADLEETYINRTRQDLFRKKFAELGSDCQKLLQLFFKGEKMRDIATQLGYQSEQYTKKRKFQCKEKLVALVKADHRYQELAHP